MQSKVTIIQYILFFILLIFVNSCSMFEPRMKGEIEAIDFIDTYDIEKGECCTISWNIKNADKIVFQTKSVPSQASVQVCPEDTTIYTISTANADQTKFFKIKVNVNPYSPKIKTGSEFVTKTTDTISIELSDYYSGTIPAQYNSRINKLKITRIFEQNNQLLVNFLPLDLFGNFVDGLAFNERNLSAQFVAENQVTPCRVNTIDRYKSDDKHHFFFIVECSFNAQFLDKILSQIRSSISTFSTNDLVSIYFVNHKVRRLIDRASPSDASLQLSQSRVLPQGLNSTANALIEVLENIQNQDISNQYKPIVVLCNFSGDNSSITFTLSDVVKIARKQKIPIYSIGVGFDAKSYQLSPLSNSTFAREYIISYNEIDDIRKIINEIYFSQKNGYQIELDFITNLSDKIVYQLQITTYNGENFISDKINYYPKPPEIYTPFQIVALFDHLGSELPADYYSKVDELGELLKDNPDAQVELIGYSNFENMDDEGDNKLALDRTLSIKQRLLQNGVGVSQVTTKTKGNLNPLYFFPKVEWQVAINRRVEIRWLDPSLLPFEIIAQTAVSETEANKFVDEWEKLGYRSYYQRVVQRGQDVVYQVKIWGFATESEAMNAIRILSFKFPNISFTME